MMSIEQRGQGPGNNYIQTLQFYAYLTQNRNCTKTIKRNYS